MLRTILAVLAGYGANAVLVAGTEQVLPKFMQGTSYLVTDLITQCLYEVAGYVCCLFSERLKRRLAVFVPMGLGLLIGTISVVAYWNAEPYWYQIGLLFVLDMYSQIGRRRIFLGYGATDDKSRLSSKPRQ